MKDNDMNRFIAEELSKYSSVLERHFRDMVDIEFTIENGEFYLLMARKGKRTALANLKIAMSMFCEGIMSADDVLLSLNPRQIEDLLNTEIITNANELDKLTCGLPASNGAGAGFVCFSHDEALGLIDEEQNYIYCRFEVFAEDMDIICSPYCQGVMTARGGITSHAAVACRGIGVTCISGFGDYEKLQHALKLHDNFATIDGNDGSIYGGIGNIEKSQVAMIEVTLLFQLLKIIIKCNAVSPATAPILWRLWDIVVLGCRYGRNDNTKQLVNKKSMNYISFSQPAQEEIDMIYSNLYYFDNSSMLIEDFIGFMISQLSSQVSLGDHYLYMRPLLNPMENMYFTNSYSTTRATHAGYQLVGVEFFNVNHFVDHLIDIESLKLYFTTKFYNYDEDDNEGKEGTNREYWPLNYLDFTNPKGESLIINTYDIDSLAVYINDVLISPDDLAMVYHLIRRRTYHWSWYTENNVTKKEIIRYLSSQNYLEDTHTKMYYLCEEMHLIEVKTLTSIGRSLLGEEVC